jgi:hypothetical protein
LLTGLDNFLHVFEAGTTSGSVKPPTKNPAAAVKAGSQASSLFVFKGTGGNQPNSAQTATAASKPAG